MSDDLIKRLRRWANFGYGFNASKCMNEACDALEASSAAMNQANEALEAARARIAELESDNRELAEFVIAVGGFWGKSRSTLVGENSLAACINRAFAELEAAAKEAQPVAWFHNTAPAGDKPHYEQVAKEYACHPAIPLYAAPASKDAIRREAFEEASALCQAIANGFVSDVNPNRSRKAADAAKFCAREIGALSQKVGDQQ